MEKLTAVEAKSLAQQVNAPKLEKWLIENPIEKILHQVKSAAAEGFYGIEYGLPHNTPTFALMHILEKFTDLGYEISFEEHEDESQTVLFKLTIEWDEA